VAISDDDPQPHQAPPQPDSHSGGLKRRPPRSQRHPPRAHHHRPTQRQPAQAVPKRFRDTLAPKQQRRRDCCWSIVGAVWSDAAFAAAFGLGGALRAPPSRGRGFGGGRSIDL
jgi:hypothetical protein